MLGLVHLVENWESIEDYARWCRYGVYQTRKTVDGVEVRVIVGKFAFSKVFKDGNDELLKRILQFCENEGFIKVVASVPEDIFFASHNPEKPGGVKTLLIES